MINMIVDFRVWPYGRIDRIEKLLYIVQPIMFPHFPVEYRRSDDVTRHNVRSCGWPYLRVFH